MDLDHFGLRSIFYKKDANEITIFCKNLTFWITPKFRLILLVVIGTIMIKNILNTLLSQSLLNNPGLHTFEQIFKSFFQLVFFVPRVGSRTRSATGSEIQKNCGSLTLPGKKDPPPNRPTSHAIVALPPPVVSSGFSTLQLLMLLLLLLMLLLLLQLLLLMLLLLMLLQLPLIR